MLFCTLQFLLFFAVVFTVYWLLRGRQARVAWLLAASFFFYASWNKWLACIIFVTTILDYLVARGMEASSSPGWRKCLLGLSLAANLGILIYFKYANFFLDSLRQLLHALGATASFDPLEVILPIGISFYTFEAINYTVDVYRRQIPAERNLGHFLLFILFFPHLVAGPIVRARDFLPQVKRRKRWSWSRFHLGGQFLLLGMFKKLAIADRMALFADPIFKDPGSYGTGVLWLGALAYALQLYCDFSGYSDMALGLAHMLGYKLVRNFNLPYLSANMSEFWRRWHISLSTWIRDYLFIPLGGSRGTRRQTYRNLLITMTLCGLWHGAGWNYVVFGFVQGLMLIVNRLFRDWCKRRPRLDAWLQTVPGTALRVAFTFTCFTYSLIIFRCAALAESGKMMARMLLPLPGLLPTPLPVLALGLTAAVMALGHALGHKRRWQGLFERLPGPVRGLSYGTMLTLTLLLAPDASKAFIYFQF